MDFNLLKNTTIKEFRAKFFNNVDRDEELEHEFAIFTNQRNSMALFNDYLHAWAKFELQKIWNASKIGKNIGNIALLRARAMQAEKDLEEHLKEVQGRKNEEFTEEGFVEWVSATSKYFGFEIRDDKTMFDFLVMAKKMNADIERERKEIEKIKKRK